MHETLEARRTAGFQKEAVYDEKENVSVSGTCRSALPDFTDRLRQIEERRQQLRGRVGLRRHVLAEFGSCLFGTVFKYHPGAIRGCLLIAVFGDLCQQFFLRAELLVGLSGIGIFRTGADRRAGRLLQL